MNSWDRIGEGKKTGSCTKVIQDPKEAFTDFLQRLASTVNRMISNSKARQIVAESLAFENANSQNKRIIRPLKVRSSSLEEWIQDTINSETHEHDDAWIREVISRVLRKIEMSNL